MWVDPATCFSAIGMWVSFGGGRSGLLCNLPGKQLHSLLSVVVGMAT